MINIKKFFGLGLILLCIIIGLLLSREKTKFDYNIVDTIQISTNPVSSTPNITLNDKEDIKTLIQMINDAKGKPILFDGAKGWICNIYIDKDYKLVLNGSTIKINRSLYRLDIQDINKIIKFVRDKEIE